MPTSKPTIAAPSPGRVTDDTVTAVDWDRDVLQVANYVFEVLAGTNTDKIPTAAIVSAPNFASQIITSGTNAGLQAYDRAAPQTAFFWLYRSGAHIYIYSSEAAGPILDIDPATGIATRTLEAWTVISSFSGTPTAWVDGSASSGMQTVRYKKNALGEVWLVGSVKTGTVTSAAFTLPAGFRPLSYLYERGIDAANTQTRIDISTAGVVTPQTGSSTTYIAFNIKFPTV